MVAPAGSARLAAFDADHYRLAQAVKS